MSKINGPRLWIDYFRDRVCTAMTPDWVNFSIEVLSYEVCSQPVSMHFARRARRITTICSILDPGNAHLSQILIPLSCNWLRSGTLRASNLEKAANERSNTTAMVLNLLVIVVAKLVQTYPCKRFSKDAVGACTANSTALRYLRQWTRHCRAFSSVAGLGCVPGARAQTWYRKGL